eukprot:SAG31_NODE_5163_length_2705_cov_1.725249_1_plen_100_part_00
MYTAVHRAQKFFSVFVFKTKTLLGCSRMFLFPYTCISSCEFTDNSDGGSQESDAVSLRQANRLDHTLRQEDGTMAYNGEFDSTNLFDENDDAWFPCETP